MARGRWVTLRTNPWKVILVKDDGTFVGRMTNGRLTMFKSSGWGVVVSHPPKTLMEVFAEEAEVVESVRDKVRARYAL
jgi:hypothetical protein